MRAIEWWQRRTASSSRRTRQRPLRNGDRGDRSRSSTSSATDGTEDTEPSVQLPTTQSIESSVPSDVLRGEALTTGERLPGARGRSLARSERSSEALSLAPDWEAVHYEARQVLAGMRRHGTRPRRLSARRRPDADVFRSVQQPRGDAWRTRSTRSGDRGIFPGASNTIRRASRFSTTSAS